MPDQDLLPPGHALTSAPRPPAGLGDVLQRAGRRRRRQQAGVLATTAAACAAVLAFTMSSGGAVDSLRGTPATRTGQDVPPMQPSRVPGPDDTAPTIADGSAGSVSGSTAQGTGAQRAAAQARQDKARAAVAAQQKAPAGGEVGPPHTTTAYDPSRSCTGYAPVQPTGWCGYYDGATTGRAGHRVELAETLCRLPGQGAGKLQTDTGEQARFDVSDRDGYHMWQWSKGRHFSKTGTTFDVPAGSCVRWYVGWNVADNAGKPLQPGAYTVDATPLAYPPAAAYAYSNAAAFVTFTVTA